MGLSLSQIGRSPIFPVKSGLTGTLLDDRLAYGAQVYTWL